MSETYIQAALKEAERATKKQKTCSVKCANAVSALQRHVQILRDEVWKLPACFDAFTPDLHACCASLLHRVVEKAPLLYHLLSQTCARMSI